VTNGADPTRVPEYLATLTFEHRKTDDTWLGKNERAQEAFYTATECLSTLKAGAIDPWLGLKIDTIIRKSTRYIVYPDSELDVQWWWVTRPDQQAVDMLQASIGQLTKESSFLLVGRRPWAFRGERPPAQVNFADRYLAKEIRSLMGEALALALNGGSQADCTAVLDEAKRYIAVAKDQRTRPLFVTFFLIAVGAVGAVLGLWACLFSQCCATQMDHRFVTKWLEAAVAGSVGALLSAMLRTKDLGLEPAARWKGLAVEAVARALIGAGSGVLVGFAFDSGLLLNGAIHHGNNAQGDDVSRILRLFLCVASGISERMLPSLVGKAESLTSGAPDDSGTQSGNRNGSKGTTQPPGGTGPPSTPAAGPAPAAPPPSGSAAAPPAG